MEARVTNRGCWKRQRQSQREASLGLLLALPPSSPIFSPTGRTFWKPAGKEAGETEFSVTLTTSEQTEGSRRNMISTMIPIKKIDGVAERIKMCSLRSNFYTNSLS